MGMDECRVCKHFLAICQAMPGDYCLVKCPICGDFSVSGTAWAVLEHKSGSPKLSAYLRERTYTKTNQDILSSNFIEKHHFNDYSVSEKQERLLKALATISQAAGREIYLDLDKDYPLGWAADSGEFRWQIESLKSKGLISKRDSTSWRLTITVDGWIFLENLQKKSNASNRVFVAMSFDPSMDSVWVQAIYPAIKDAGYEPYRVDKDIHIDRIDVKIMAEIREAKFLVADVTQHKQGVYFEAGFALGLGKPVFWTVKSDYLSSAHFDTRQFNHIKWDGEADLRVKLNAFILALMGRGGSGEG